MFVPYSGQWAYLLKVFYTVPAEKKLKAKMVADFCPKCDSEAKRRKHKKEVKAFREAIAKERRSGIESVCETLNPQDFKINLEDRFEIAFKDKALRDEVETNFKLPKHLHFTRSKKGGSLFL
jgi:hypothetical protein